MREGRPVRTRRMRNPTASEIGFLTALAAVAMVAAFVLGFAGAPSLLVGIIAVVIIAIAVIWTVRRLSPRD